jgi:hypothetical protein
VNYAAEELFRKAKSEKRKVCLLDLARSIQGTAAVSVQGSAAVEKKVRHPAQLGTKTES